jgi:hypothetical protein
VAVDCRLVEDIHLRGLGNPTGGPDLINPRALAGEGASDSAADRSLRA